MTIRQKQVAAALVAVDQYLQEEAAARAAQASATPPRVAGPETWPVAGRMDAMNLRRLMQLRAFAQR